MHVVHFEILPLYLGQSASVGSPATSTAAEVPTEGKNAALPDVSATGKYFFYRFGKRHYSRSVL